MKAKTGIIKAVNFNPENYSEVVRNSFTDLLHDGIEYKQLSAMEHYFNEHFEQVFDDQEAFEKWLKFGNIDIWHEEDKSIQIALTLEQNTDLAIDVPEIAMYRKEHNISSYREGNVIYSYVNWLLDEHRALLTRYGANIIEI